jgi:hypothetical protein
MSVWCHPAGFLVKAAAGRDREDPAVTGTAHRDVIGLSWPESLGRRRQLRQDAILRDGGGAANDRVSRCHAVATICYPAILKGFWSQLRCLRPTRRLRRGPS